jgi:hypothetical protein
MGIWESLRLRLFGERDRGIGAAEVPARQEQAAGRILDDEGLRGDLTDEEYQPLLDWALAVTDAVAAGTVELDDHQAEPVIDAGIGVVREVLRTSADAIVAHHEGRAEDCRWALDGISQSWKPSIIGGDESDLPATLWRPLQQLADRLDAEPDLSGPELATAIVGALTPPAHTSEEGGSDATGQQPEELV